MNIFTPLSNFSKVSRKLLYLLTLLIFQTGFTFAQDAPFITVWKTDNEGTSEDNQITIPGTGTNYLIEWEEVGNEADNNGSETGTDEHTVTFPSAGTYRVKISGDFTRIEFLYNEDNTKIIDIEQWGYIIWSSFANAFYFCTNLNQTATDAPDLSNVTDMSDMFLEAHSFNGYVSNWDVSNITEMGGVFAGAKSFNGDLSSWNVSNVTDMNNMFVGADLFTGDLSSWNVSKVTNMSNMFAGAESFNGNIEAWSVSNVTNMSTMFSGAESFDGKLDSWDVSNVTKMRGMFEDAIQFNGNLKKWDVSNVTDMSFMFHRADSFNGELNNWNVSKVTDMRAMFSGADSFNGQIREWIVSNVMDMSGMFLDAKIFNDDLNRWDVSKVTNMNRMFLSAESFNGDLSSWNVSNVTDMSQMFYNAFSFNNDLNNWDVSNVINMSEMFSVYTGGTSVFNGDLSNWNVSNVKDMNGMFWNAKSFNQDISTWNVTNVTNFSNMFKEAVGFDQNLGNWNLSNANNLYNFLSYSGLSTLNYDLALEGWIANENIPSNIEIYVYDLSYCASEKYRQQLIDDYGWNIIGDAACNISLEKTYPATDETRVEKDTDIYLTFDQEIEELDLSGINLKDVSGNTISLSDIYIDSLTLHLVHNGLGSNTYEVVIPESSIISITGKENDSISWTFATKRILSSKEQQKSINHSAFPNPFSDYTTIQFNLPQIQSVNLLVFDMKGQLVRKEQYENLGSENQSIKFERNGLPAGLYRYQLQSADGAVGGKMLLE